MKKILMTLSLALAAIIAIPSVMNAQEAKATEKIEINKECKKIESKDCNCNDDCKAGKDFKGKKGDSRRHGKKGKFANGKEGKMVKGHHNPLFNGITLTAEQKDQIKALREKRVAEHKAARAEMKKDKAEKKAADAEIRKQKAQAFDQDVEKILTPEQFKKYKENKEVIDKNKGSHCK
ncbi:MAG: hypothetical protein NC095_10885 [Muribaculum sp.]|nr:hypothetical protein [Muribaculum sp.]